MHVDAWALAQTVQAFIFMKEYRKLKKLKYNIQNGREKYGGKKLAFVHIWGKNSKIILQILVWNCFESLFMLISYLNQFTFA